MATKTDKKNRIRKEILDAKQKLYIAKALSAKQFTVD